MEPSKILRVFAATILGVGVLTSCKPATETLAPSPQVAMSSQPACEFAERLAAFIITSPDYTADLRYLNEQWRSLLESPQGLRPAEKKAGQAILSALNIHLAHETAELLQQALAITATTHEKIEGLRKYTPTTGIIEIPASLTRNLNNELDDCCLNALQGNAASLVREEKGSPLYQMGTMAYFINRDVGQIVNNQRSLADYRDQLQQVTASLPSPIDVITATTWLQCPSSAREG